MGYPFENSKKSKRQKGIISLGEVEFTMLFPLSLFPSFFLPFEKSMNLKPGDSSSYPINLSF